MLLIQVKVIKGVFKAPQKQEIVERLTVAVVGVEGRSLRDRNVFHPEGGIWRLLSAQGTPIPSTPSLR